MEYIQLNTDWNADPNTPETTLKENGNIIELEFYLNYFLFDSFKEGNKGKLTFKNCYKYLYSICNDEAYFHEKYRFTHNQLPFGEFYQLKNATNFKGRFIGFKTKSLKHYIFIMKETILECYAEDFKFELKKEN
tara:strand:- start:783 stop:1184 length:402 start_codon:yes stop_codon:yes gene_type:complete